MRFLVSIDKQWNVRITCPKVPGWSHDRGKLDKTDDAGDGTFPLPPKKEPTTAAWSRELISPAHERIVNRMPERGDIQALGTYLFETLIGAEAWEAILRVSDEGKAKLVELALAWPSNEKDLHRLNWEMMYNPDEGFLAEGVKKHVQEARGVAFTRVVLGTASDAWEARQMTSPPRVLFVIGTSEVEASIRAGAEYLGLLRGLKRNGLGIHSRLLQQATPRLLQQAIECFRPDAVHFICHGEVDPQDNRGYLVLTSDDAGNGAAGEQRFYGQQLIKFLGKPETRPSIVVLSACFSAGDNRGRMLGAHRAAPLAAELVASGIPIVVGMAGRVADRACRLFSVRFGETLLEGSSMVLAATEGRWSAFAEGPPPENAVDWALPTVFMAERVPEDFAPLTATAGEKAVRIEKRVQQYDLNRLPVFCGREAFFESYYQLLEPRCEANVLVCFTESPTPRLGKTRLLKELAAQAIREGHVPIMISSDERAWEPDIRNTGQLAVELFRAIKFARDVFELDPPFDTQLLNLLLKKRPPISGEWLAEIKTRTLPFSELLDHFRRLEDDLISPASLKEALSNDLTQLAKEARKKHSSVEEAGGRAIIFLDEVHQYDKAIPDLFEKLLGPFGFGTLDTTAPVVVALSKGTAADPMLDRLLERGAPKPWLQRTQLRVLENNGEDLLAYGHVLLHPFKKEVLPGFSDKPWAVNDAVDQTTAGVWEGVFRRLLKGIPDQIAEAESMYGLAEGASQQQYLVGADDDDVLATLRDRRRP